MTVDKCLPLSGPHHDVVERRLDSMVSTVSDKGGWFDSIPSPCMKECIALHGVKGTGHQGLRLELPCCLSLPLFPSHPHCPAQGRPQGPTPWDFVQQDMQSQSISAEGTLVAFPLFG